MKKVLAFIVVLSLIFTGCSDKDIKEVPKESEKSEENIEEIIYLSVDNRLEFYGISYDEYVKYESMLWDLLYNESLTGSWEGNPASANNCHGEDFVIKNIEKEGDTASLDLLIYGNVYINPNTLEESYDGVKAVMKKERDYYYPAILPLGEAKLKLKGEGEELMPVSNNFEAFSQPGISFLKRATEPIKEELSKSAKLSDKFPDMTKWMKRAIFMEVLGTRYIESIDDLTMYDLEHIDNLSLSYPNVLREDGENLPGDFVFSSEPLKYMKSLRYFETYFLLDDYSVFKDMELEYVNIDFSNQDEMDINEAFKNFEIGKAGNISIDGFRSDIEIDLKGSDVYGLSVSSWTNAVTDFKGCENLKTLYINSTTSDMSLLERKNFPAIEVIQIDIYSDTPRIRNFRNLATFPENVYIYMTLSYQAANNETIKSLEGVRLSSLNLNPGDGPYPLNEPDRELVEKIDVPQGGIIWQL